MILVSVEKGKQRYNKATKGNQQADYPYKYQNDIRSSHWRHLPSYVFRQAGHWLGRLPPLSWVPYWNTITVRQEFQSDSLFMEYVESVSISISKQSHGAKRKTEKCRFYALFSLNVPYSNSIVAGGFPVQSYNTLFTPFTSLTILDATFPSTSQGICAGSAVIKSNVLTARNTTA